MARISIFVPALIVVIAVSHPSARARNPPSLDALFAAYRAKPDEDAFEIAWHKTSIALLEGLRRPDSLEEYGIRPLTNRMAAAPTSHPMLIDPWIEIARGVSEEQFGGMEHWGASTALDMPR